MNGGDKTNPAAAAPPADEKKKFVYSRGAPAEAAPKKERETPAEPADKPPASVAPEGGEKAAPDSGEAKKDGGKPEKKPRPPKAPKTQEQLKWEAARRQEFLDRVWNPWLRPVVALVAICLTVSLLLGITNLITAPIIKENAAQAAAEAMDRLLPGAGAFNERAVPEGAANVTAIHQADGGAGYIIQAFGKGYGGSVPALVAFDDAGTIVGVEFLENNETKGLGEKLVSEDGFRSQFVGLPAQPVALTQLQTIANATISSNAGLSAVNAAIAAYGLLTGGDAFSGVEGAVQTLLPGEALTGIALDAEGVQPAAWRTDAGNYIIAGQADSGSSVIVAAVAMDANGAILNLWVDTSGEHNGATLGNDKTYTEQFIGESLPVGVDTVADLTGTSTAVNQAVDNALAALAAAKEAA